MFEIRLIVRTAHLLAAADWGVGSLVYIVVILPALRMGRAEPEIYTQIATLFRSMVNICMGVLVLSGAYLMFDRLTTTSLGWPYLTVLGIKIITALGMFVLAIYLGQS